MQQGLLHVIKRCTDSAHTAAYTHGARQSCTCGRPARAWRLWYASSAAMSSFSSSARRATTSAVLAPAAAAAAATAASCRAAPSRCQRSRSPACSRSASLQAKRVFLGFDAPALPTLYTACALALRLAAGQRAFLGFDAPALPAHAVAHVLALCLAAGHMAMLEI